MVTERRILIVRDLCVPLHNFRSCIRTRRDPYDRGSKGKRLTLRVRADSLVVDSPQLVLDYPAKQEASEKCGGQCRGIRTADGIPPAGAHLTPGSVVLDSVRPAVQARIFSMVGVGLDVIRGISGHHCANFPPCSGMDASEKQPDFLLHPRPFSSDSSFGFCRMEHALTRGTLASMAEARTGISVDWWCVGFCCVLHLSRSRGHQRRSALRAAQRGAYYGLVLLRVFVF